MNTVCLSESANIILKHALRSKGCELIEIRKTGAVYEAVSSHSDIYLCKLRDELVVAQEQLPMIHDELLNCGASFSPGVSVLGFQYPMNVKFNAAQLGRYLIHNTKYTDPLVLERATALGLDFIDVKQGYTKCSLVIIDDRSAITSDLGLASALKRYDLDILLISSGHVRLPGFDFGFLGGASGKVGDEILFNGDLTAHPDFEKIKKFIIQRGFNPVWFKEYPLEDIGSIIQL